MTLIINRGAYKGLSLQKILIGLYSGLALIASIIFVNFRCEFKDENVVIPNAWNFLAPSLVLNMDASRWHGFRKWM